MEGMGPPTPRMVSWACHIHVSGAARLCNMKSIDIPRPAGMVNHARVPSLIQILVVISICASQ